MRMAGINIINANSSQPILSHEDQAVFQEILGTMYQPPSDLNSLHDHFTGQEDESMHHLPHYILLMLYICLLNIPEECV